MANCSVRKWDSNLIGEPTNYAMPTFFRTRMFSMGNDFSKKKIVYIAITVNWDSDIEFNVTANYRKDINSLFKYWNTISTSITFPNYGLSNNNNGTTAYKGGATFILPFNDEESSIARLFYNIQFEIGINIYKQNSAGTGNVSINDISLLYRKMRDYSVED